MKRLLAATIVALSYSASALASQPPDVVVSDDRSNTAVGSDALLNLSDGIGNTAVGIDTLQTVTNGSSNTALGSLALAATTGQDNTGIGSYAAGRLSTGSQNTAVGSYALFSPGFASFDDNTAVGFHTMYNNLSGSDNTAVGSQAMYNNTTGHDNVAIGEETLWGNTTGQQNLAVGRSAMRNSTTGSFNAVQGYATCWSCRSASQNTGYGFKTLYSLTSGTSNIAIGYQSGYNLTGSNNIDIANVGVAGESGVIRIGSQSAHTTAFVAGILGNPMTGSTVVINANGQLGVLSSSRRYKTDVESMRSSSDKLAQLRPVTFHMKDDPQAPLQYGLIAEEVDRVLPDLVIRDKYGGIQGVRYDELAPLLLKQAQEQQAAFAAQRAQLEELVSELTQMKMQLAELRQQNVALQDDPRMVRR